MAHEAQQKFVFDLKTKNPDFFSNKKVLEIGSLNINGSIRNFFENCHYLGIDVGKGEGVDLVCPGQDFDDPDESYDVTASTECFEHNPYWKETFLNMIRMTKSKGLVFFTCATTGRAEHGTSSNYPQDSPLTLNIGWDYYKNLTEYDFRKFIDFDNYFVDYKFSTQPHPFYDLYFWGIKK